jgi:hypothetical protein
MPQNIEKVTGVDMPSPVKKPVSSFKRRSANDSKINEKSKHFGPNNS